MSPDFMPKEQRGSSDGGCGVYAQAADGYFPRAGISLQSPARRRVDLLDPPFCQQLVLRSCLNAGITTHLQRNAQALACRAAEPKPLPCFIVNALGFSSRRR